MKSVILILTLVLSIESFGQRDNIILSSLKKKFNLSEYDSPTEIIEFNKDTILIAGYLSDASSSAKNIIYKTDDGGINWKQIRFNGNAWIYDSHHDRNGNVWMGGSDNYVHYSPDFGDTWQRRPEPLVPINRVHSIFMVDTEFGIAGGLHNGLALTFNNWNSTEQIPTPLDQRKFRILSNSSRDEIERAAIVDSILLINQNEHVYFSKLKNIQWTEFNIPVVDFSVDESGRNITLQSLNGKCFVLSSNLGLIKTYQEDFIREKVKDDSIVLQTDEFFKTEIKSLSLKATNWVFDKHGHMVDIYKPVTQKANFIEKTGVYHFKSKKNTAQKLNFTSAELAKVFSFEQVNFSLPKVSQNLSFADIDIENYKSFLDKEELKRKEEKKWGGDFTSQIPLDNRLFHQDYNTVIKEINPTYIKAIYNHLIFPLNFRNNQSDKIELTIISNNSDTLKISNDNSLIFSLPWTIQFRGQSIKSYNPQITKFIRSILPTDFLNYQMLLGGQLIFELLQEQIIDELEYKNGY